MKIRLLILVLLFVNYSQAKNMFWIGDSGDWSDAKHWSYTTGGESCGTLPLFDDDVIFDENSFSTKQPVISFSSISIKSLTFNSSSNTQFQGENLTLSHSFLLKQNSVFNSTLNFISTNDEVHVINTGGFTQNSNINITKGNWELNNHLITKETTEIQIKCSTFNSNTFSIVSGTITVENTKTNLSNSSVFAYNKVNFGKAKKIGSNPQIYTPKDSKDFILGKYKGSQLKAQTEICSGGLSIDVDIIENLCNGDGCNGTVTLTTSGSVGPFNYELFDPPSSISGSGFVFPNLCVTNYSFNVTDSSNQIIPGFFAICSFDVDVNEPPVLGLIIQGIFQPDCPEDCTGRAITNLTGGTGNISVVWESGEITPFPLALCPGYNTVTMTDDNNCIAVDSVLIPDLPPITFDVTITPPTCNGDSDAEILINNEAGANGAGAPKPWTYIFNPIPPSGATVNPAISLGAGDVTVTVIDSTGCQKDSLIQIINPDVLTIAAINPQSVSCFGFCDGELTALPNGGVYPYSYEWFDNTTGLTTGFTDSITTIFCEGDYYVEVTDANGCVKQSLPINISTPTEIIVNAQVYPENCVGNCDGAVDVDPSGGSPNYTYQWITSPIGANIGITDSVGDLCPGEYQIIVFDINLCESTPIIVEVLPAEPLILNLTSINPTCYGLCNGTITANAGGGDGGFTYNWVPNPPVGQGTNIISNLCGEIQYTVTVTDANTCTINDNTTLTSPPKITFDVTLTPPTCFGDTDAEILISNENGGVGAPFTYFYNPVPNNGQGSNPATGYASGFVVISVFDAILCQQDSTIEIVDPPVLSITAINPQEVSCLGFCDGQLTALPDGGVYPYSYEWFNNTTGLTTGFTDSIPTTFCEGDYFVEVTDANGCVVQSITQNIGSPTEVIANTQAYPLPCFDDCQGAVDVDPLGGTPGYTYQWTTVPGGAGVGATDSISGLCEGQYQIIVFDANLCPSTPQTVEVFNVPELTLVLNPLNPTCYNICNGSINAIPNGGAGGFTYDWSPIPPTGQNTATISNLCSNIQYDLTVTDVNNCTVTDNTTLTPPPIYDISTNQTNLICFGDLNGTISVTVNSGGAGIPYTYAWAPGTPDGQGTNSISNLTQGNYSVTISDGVICDTTLVFTIIAPPELTANATIISHVTCNTDCDGSAQVVIDGGTPIVSISWNDAANQTTSPAINLCAGNYIVTLTDDNLCTATDNITILEPSAFDLNINQTVLNCFGDCNATATVNVISGGTPNYTVTWNDPLNQVGNTATLCTGNYTATLVDQAGCDSIIPFNIAEPDELTISIAIIDNACFGTCEGNAEITTTGGIGVLTFEWFISGTNVPLGINNVNSGLLCPGDYYAIVTDGNGCSTQSPDFTIIELPEIEINVLSTTDVDCNASTGTAEINTTGGAGGYVYTWTPMPGGGQGTTIGTGLAAGVYNVNVLDVDGCIGNQGIVINSIALEVLNLDSIDVSCFGICDGEVSVEVTCLEPPCIIEWFDNLTGISTTQIGNNATMLCAGEYLALLTNNLGCVISDTIEIGTPPEIIANVTPMDELCFGACNGSANVIASGGEGNLFYNWNPNPGAGQATVTAFGLCAGNWDLTVTDDSTCFVNVPFVINAPDEILINTISATDINCFGDLNGTVTVLASGGNGVLTVEWFICGTNTSVGTGANLGGLPPGDYYAVITDASTCSVNSICVGVNDKNEITAVINTQNSSCFGDCDGMIEVVGNGGNGIYFFQWLDNLQNPIAGQTNNIISNICQGTYHIEVMDGNGCTEIFGPIDMTQPNNPWDVTLSSSNENCFGVCDGQAEVVVNSGNNPPYTYLWDDPNTETTPQTTNTLCPGTYTVIISDAGVCDTTVQITILPAEPFNLQGTQTNNLCHGDCLGTASVVPSGGATPYIVTWSDGQIGNNAIGLCVGNTTATIQDDEGCILDSTFIITQPIAPLSINSMFSNDASCGNCNGSATVNIIGGTTGYTYNWLGTPTGDGTNNVTNLCSGITSVNITDANNCLLTQNIAISDIDAEDLTVTVSDATCFGVDDGSAEVVFVCSDPGCVQEWFDVTTGITTGETTINLGPVSAGDYFVQVTNASDCISIETITIGTPTEIIPHEALTEITCVGDSDASITLTPTGGSGNGYLYSWNPIPPNGDNTNTAIGIGPGLWSVTITDGDGCSQNSDFNILDTIPISITPSLIDVNCNGADNGSITTIISGGYGGYTFQWLLNGVPILGETNSNITGLAPGNYNIQVTDINGCIQTLANDITISQPLPVNTPITSTNILCNGSNDGTATINPTGGNLPYIINWYDGSNNLIGQNTNIATNLAPGDYYATVTDDNLCSFTTTIITITEPTPLTFTLTSNDATCFGVCDGGGQLVLNGGTPNYNYEWLDVLGNAIPNGTLANINFLCEGNYTVEGTDDNGCSIGIQNVVIGGFSEITANVFSNNSTCGFTDGNASVFANGGNPGYSYQWQDAGQVNILGQTNSTLLNIGSGTYYVVVSDANLCSEKFQVNLSDLPTTTIVWDLVKHPECFGGNNGELQVTVTGISMPLSFVWNPDGEITEDISSLTADNYVLQVTDALGCLNFYDTTLVEPNEIIITPTVIDSDCDLCNGNITVNLQGGIGVLSTTWNNGATGTFIDGLCPSVYEITVLDGNGCIEIETITVNNNSGLIADAVVNAISCFDECDGTISVSATGGAQPYTYNWLTNGSVNNTETNLCADIYLIEVTDAIGCISPLQIDLINPAEVIINNTMTPPTCGNTDGQISITSTGGGLPHTYLWNTTATTPVINGLDAGIFTLIVTSNSGCTQDFILTLNNTTGPDVSLQASDLSCNGDCNGLITANIGGGTPTYTQQWFSENGAVIGGETNQNLANQCVGIYTLEVTDNAGCIIYETIELDEPDAILLNTPFSINPSCFGNCNGSIVTNPIGGTQPFTFTWNDPNTQTTINAIELCDGVYNVIITDANGCTLTQTDSVKEPSEISILLDNVIDATCVNSPDGSIDITINGGTPPMIVQWTDGTGKEISTDEDLSNLLPMDYYVTVTDINGCTKTDTITVDTVLVVLAFAGNDTIICFENSTLLTGTSNQTDVDFTWFDLNSIILSDTNELSLPNQLPSIDTYILLASYGGCSHTDTVIVTIQDIVYAEAGPNIELLSNQTEVIGGDPTNNINTTVLWSPPIYLDDTLATNPYVIKPNEDTWYVVTVTDINGCSNFDSVYVEVIPSLIIPNGFSPNADGKNDTWELLFKDDFPNMEVSVYNRWGELLFYDNNNYPKAWDGKFKSEELPVGTYYYVIDLHSDLYPEPFTGPLTIMR